MCWNAATSCARPGPVWRAGAGAGGAGMDADRLEREESLRARRVEGERFRTLPPPPDVGLFFRTAAKAVVELAEELAESARKPPGPALAARCERCGAACSACNPKGAV